jgi:hypothetical protein
VLNSGLTSLILDGEAINQKWKFYYTIITPFRAGAMMIVFGINFVDPFRGRLSIKSGSFITQSSLPLGPGQ